MFELAHKLWIEVQLTAPPLLQDTLIAGLKRARELTRLVAKPLLPIDQLSGPGCGGPLTINYVGPAFAKSVVKEAFFTQPVQERHLGQVPFWRIGRMVHDRSVDITFIAAPKWVIRLLPRHTAFVLPHYVDQVIDLTGSWDDVKNRMHKGLRKLLRRTRNYGYEWRLTSNPEDLKRFYHTMYLPTMTDRHGELSSPMSLREASQIFRHGWLFMLKRDGCDVAGGLAHAQNNIFYFIVLGVLNGDPNLVHEGAQTAIYDAVVQWAHKQGYKAVHLMGGPPYLNNLFLYKRRWGASAVLPDDEHRLLWLKVQRDTPAVRRAMQTTPFIALDEQNNLQVIIIADSAEAITPEVRANWQKDLFTPGLTGYHVYQFNDLLGESPSSTPVEVLSPMTAQPIH